MVNHFLGSYASTALANAYVAATGWPHEDMSGARSHALVAGLQYYNTTDGGLYTYNGTAWQEEDRCKASQYTVPDDATPTVAHGTRVLLASPNVGATTITQLDDAVTGQVVTLVCASAVNPPGIADAGNFVLGGAFVGGQDDTITLMKTATVWIELARSAN